MATMKAARTQKRETPNRLKSAARRRKASPHSGSFSGRHIRLRRTPLEHNANSSTKNSAPCWSRKGDRTVSSSVAARARLKNASLVWKTTGDNARLSSIARLNALFCPGSVRTSCTKSRSRWTRRYDATPRRFWARLFRTSADETHCVSKFACYRHAGGQERSADDRHMLRRYATDTRCEITVRAAYPLGKSARYAIIRAACAASGKSSPTSASRRLSLLGSCIL